MALIKCKECGKEIATSAKTCPQCGAPNKQEYWTFGKIVVAVLLIGVALSITANLKYPATASRPSDASVQSEAESAASSPSDSTPKEPTSAWTYSSQSDSISGKTVEIATTTSTNSFEFGFPYAESQKATLMLRQHPRWGNDVILSVERGQFLCHSECQFAIRFDDDSVSAYSIGEPQDSSTNYMFIRNYPRFVTALRKAKTVRIEAQFYQEGMKVLEFDVSGFKWDLSAPEKSSLAAAEANTVLEGAKREARSRCARSNEDAIDNLNCEMEIGDCVRNNSTTSSRARCLGSVPSKRQE